MTANGPSGVSSFGVQANFRVPGSFARFPVSFDDRVGVRQWEGLKREEAHSGPCRVRGHVFRDALLRAGGRALARAGVARAGTGAGCGDAIDPHSGAGSGRDCERFRRPSRGLEVAGQGVVTRILADDRAGSPHQRFILRLPSGQTLLIAHNIALADRIPSLKQRRRRAVQRRIRMEPARRSRPLDARRPARPARGGLDQARRPHLPLTRPPRADRHNSSASGQRFGISVRHDGARVFNGSERWMRTRHDTRPKPRARRAG